MHRVEHFTRSRLEAYNLDDDCSDKTMVNDTMYVPSSEPPWSPIPRRSLRRLSSSTPLRKDHGHRYHARPKLASLHPLPFIVLHAFCGGATAPTKTPPWWRFPYQLRKSRQAGYRTLMKGGCHYQGCQQEPHRSASSTSKGGWQGHSPSSPQHFQHFSFLFRRLPSTSKGGLNVTPPSGKEQSRKWQRPHFQGWQGPPQGVEMQRNRKIGNAPTSKGGRATTID
jgi:hypothetical protein